MTTIIMSCTNCILSKVSGKPLERFCATNTTHKRRHLVVSNKNKSDNKTTQLCEKCQRIFTKKEQMSFNDDDVGQLHKTMLKNKHRLVY